MIAKLDEFLDWENEQPERHEFLDGTIRPRTGGTEDLDRLSVNQMVCKRTWIEEAVVVVEVLSPRTAKDDLTRKGRAYTLLPTMRTAVYVSQDEARLDPVRRQADGSFADEVVEGLDGVLELPEIGVRLSMAEIYEDTLVARTADRA